MEQQKEMVKPKTMDELIQGLYRIYSSKDIDVKEVQDLMESYDSNPQDWKQYAKFDPYRYTRNLVDKGNGKFNLIVLCWGEGHGSSIHDHTNSHCFMKMLQGQLKETLFDWPDDKSEGSMVQRSERILLENTVAYINDSMGLHRVENVSHTEGSVSLHLYSPPFDLCQTFDQRTGHKNTVKMTFTSEFGQKIKSPSTASQENN
ncbi:cysteine dioxygenase type 1 [Gouania willdenowi]|uniref:Cysteine dioxygenase n=1 Tax=Gouania willdenowi TaxID=441366 RepID=A0A8C5GNA7_GOUWI|nr:cysteine dioxygenase type 1 [Gouania willdenowi]